MLNVGLIVGSTRPNRFADTPAQWLVEGASARKDLQLAVLDLRDFELPFLKEPVPPSFTGGAYSQPEAEACPNVRRKARRMRPRSAKPVCRATTPIGW
jgi:NAD(P)H-dependent FMN reductase